MPMSSTPPISWVRLRYGARDIDLFVGEHIVGRAPDCAVSIDDPLASRSHALLSVRARGVTIEDLGSRNGVVVNNARIDGPHPLAVGDVVSIGATTLTVQSINGPTAMPAQRAEGGRPSTKLQEARRVATTLSHSSASAPRRLEAFHVLGDTARGALVVGRAAEAEAVLDRPLAEVLSTLRCGIGLEPELIEYAAHQAVLLARALAKPYWLDYVFDLYTTCGAIMPAHLLDRLEDVLDEVSAIDQATVWAYVATVRRAPDPSPTDVALRRRVEALAHRLDRSAPPG